MQNAKCKIYFALALFLFALGLMAKPMLVTLPFVLLLLDYWPLRRLRPPFRRPLAEKIPFFILAAAASVAAFLAQRHGGAVVSLAGMPVWARVANVPVAYARDSGKTFCPADLAVYYPMQRHWPDRAVGGSSVLLALVTIGAIWRVRARPWLAVGWFWFLGMLVPVIGLVQIGWQSMADRYDYLPGIGLTIMIIWAAKEWIPPSATQAAAALAWLALAGCLAATRMQVGVLDEQRNPVPSRCGNNGRQRRDGKQPWPCAVFGRPQGGSDAALGAGRGLGFSKSGGPITIWATPCWPSVA